MLRNDNNNEASDPDIAIDALQMNQLPDMYPDERKR